MALFFVFRDALAGMKDRQADHLALFVADDHVVVGQLAVVGVDANIGSKGEVEDCRLLLSRDVCPSDSVNLCKMTIM